jgi:hypothetical protein
LPYKGSQLRFLFNQRLDPKGTKELSQGNSQLDGDEVPVLVFIDEGVESSQRLVPGLSWAVIRLHALDGADCPFRNSLEKPSKALSAFARIVNVDREPGVASPVFWLGESPYEVVETRPEVGHYIASDGREGRWRRLMPDQDPVAVSYGDTAISWRVNQHSIRMTIGVRSNERVEVGEVGFCSPDLLASAGLR